MQTQEMQCWLCGSYLHWKWEHDNSKHGQVPPCSICRSYSHSDKFHRYADKRDHNGGKHHERYSDEHDRKRKVEQVDKRNSKKQDDYSSSDSEKEHNWKYIAHKKAYKAHVASVTPGADFRFDY